jgi:hypothetical protein
MCWGTHEHTSTRSPTGTPSGFRPQGSSYSASDAVRQPLLGNIGCTEIPWSGRVRYLMGSEGGFKLGGISLSGALDGAMGRQSLGRVPVLVTEAMPRALAMQGPLQKRSIVKVPSKGLDPRTPPPPLLLVMREVPPTRPPPLQKCKHQHTSGQRVAGRPGLPKKPRLARQSVTCGGW